MDPGHRAALVDPLDLGDELVVELAEASTSFSSDRFGSAFEITVPAEISSPDSSAIPTAEPPADDDLGHR